MENILTHSHSHSHSHLQLVLRGSKSSSNSVFRKPFAKFRTLNTQIGFASFHPLPSFTDTVSDSKHTTLLVETYHVHHSLRILLAKLQKEDSCPLRILTEDGDWSKDHFWAVVRFLKKASRFTEIVQVFDMWKNIEKSRINEFNYNKIISLLCEVGMMEVAVSALQEMKVQGLEPSLDTYNPIIHGFSIEGKFSDALHFVDEMREFGLEPDTETYDGLIRAYGKFQMYDKMGKCVKKMELDGCSLDHITYNILIQEYSRGGLLQRVEKLYQRMLSKGMHLQSSTFVAMLEAYTTFGMVEKMEKIYRKLLNSKTYLDDDLIRKVAEVYIKNYMFSKLEDLGLELRTAFGETDLVWCLRLLSYACLLSRKGMDTIVREMTEAKVHWNVTVANIIMLAYVKMKDFKHLRILLSLLPIYRVKPDIISIGILFDANRIGFDGNGALESWRRMGHLYRVVEMRTDSLVLTAFGKGHFLKSCEEVYSSLHPEDRERKTWTYYDLIALLSKHNDSIDCVKPK
ncbi:pentatricopeptide repeat-containing protein At4g14190, chloroplastic [Gastrolobium bilobum]|uniref:pentatricopeptide repeat-containing protein At4g14190, chloroplastic n=1 Tax=Gastrolobium bilobum TaxID=150636 RepID=UPI002AB17D07|nr:pentatricopeptide repeat-containing protein At4g14190, chloroplastic [Gastrolobium bilobum]